MEGAPRADQMGLSPGRPARSLSQFSFRQKPGEREIAASVQRGGRRKKSQPESRAMPILTSKRNIKSAAGRGEPR